MLQPFGLKPVTVPFLGLLYVPLWWPLPFPNDKDTLP